ncbi:MAG: AI-2E family transporter [Candidatus Zambryskibacteria bacterium]|nr:AI-2E family transporter [Candidatus Zambryskibacteria bacterium]
MDKDILQRYFFVGIFLLVSVLVFFLFLPFLEVLILSVIFAVVLHPIYQRVNKKFNNKPGLAALVVIFAFAVVIILPLFLIISLVLGESKDLYLVLTGDAPIDYIDKITLAIENPIKSFYPSFNLNISEYASSVVDWLTGHFSTILSSVISIVTGVVLIFISLYFFLKDGAKFKEILVDLSPLSDKHDEKIFIKVKQTIRATVSGVVLVALIQGILAGVGMLIFGVPNAFLWGSISAVASLVPGLGTAIVFIPAVIYMFIIGNTAFAVGLLLWGFLVVGLVDNFLTPYLYSRGAEIHQLLMLFAVLGGLLSFGPIGFLFGPIILALFFALIDIYQSIVSKEKSL